MYEALWYFKKEQDLYKQKKTIKEFIMWKKPEIKEISVGLEINCYACAEI